MLRDYRIFTRENKKQFTGRGGGGKKNSKNGIWEEKLKFFFPHLDKLTRNVVIDSGRKLPFLNIYIVKCGRKLTLTVH